MVFFVFVIIVKNVQNIIGSDFLKFARILTKTVFILVFVVSIIIFSLIIYLQKNTSEEFKVKKGNRLNIDTIVPVTAEYKGVELSQSKYFTTVGEKIDVDLKIFGIIPVSTVNVEVVDELHVAVLGTPFGMKIYTEGVLVIETTDVETEYGNKKPAKQAGIKCGDYIVSVDGNEIFTNEDLSDAVKKSHGEEMRFLIIRKGTKMHIKVKPELSKENNEYKIGLWVRDSSAGIGTLTFYSPATEIICGLGHGICDEDTGTLLKLNSGEIVNAEILSVEKGEVGSPGQLKGRFGGKTLGEISLNTQCGVYSILKGKLDLSNLVEIALKQEVKNGKAEILCAIDSDKAETFSCEIALRTSAYLSKTQNMIVTITDEKLLDKTGGIVQGMSGSPIIQNGKLIGAVTHVLVDDPKKGYAIFAENMLETAQSAVKQNLKEAS